MGTKNPMNILQEKTDKSCFGDCLPELLLNYPVATGLKTREARVVVNGNRDHFYKDCLILILQKLGFRLGLKKNQLSAELHLQRFSNNCSSQTQTNLKDTKLTETEQKSGSLESLLGSNDQYNISIIFHRSRDWHKYYPNSAALLSLRAGPNS